MAAGKSVVPILDYIVFVVVLLISLIIGIVFSCRQRTSEEYIHGSHSIGLVPVSISLIVSFLSAVTIQGFPAEVYLYGLEWLFATFGLLGVFYVMFTFLPIYYEMQYSSMFQYLEHRFESRKLKVMANILSLTSLVLYAGITIFGPATAIESLTGIPTIYNIVAMAVVCTIYTSFGGIRAVIWTDVFQALIMFAGILTILVIGISHVGLSSIWYELQRRGHTTIDVSPDITQRTSIWILIFGQQVRYFHAFISQSAMIRYNSLPTIKQARLCLVIASLGLLIMSLSSYCIGIVVFAYYSQLGCGPLGSKEIYSPNQIIPHFVVNVINIPGVPGIFLSALVASSLSSVSSVQNSFSTTLWTDILSNLLPPMSEFKMTLVLKLLSLLCGVLSMVVALAAMYLGGTLAIASAVIHGVVGAPLMGIYIIGGSCNFVSGAAAMVGCLCSMLFCLWLSLGRILYGTLWEDPCVINDACGITDQGNLFFLSFY